LARSIVLIPHLFWFADAIFLERTIHPPLVRHLDPSCRWLGHVAEKHDGGDDVLAGLVEDWGFARLVLDDAMIDVVSSLSSPSTMCMRHTLPLLGLLM
jgi:hypothetical protein